MAEAHDVVVKNTVGRETRYRHHERCEVWLDGEPVRDGVRETRPVCELKPGDFVAWIGRISSVVMEPNV